MLGSNQGARFGVARLWCGHDKTRAADKGPSSAARQANSRGSARGPSAKRRGRIFGAGGGGSLLLNVSPNFRTLASIAIY